MSKMSFFDKLGVLINLSTKSGIYLVVLCVLIVFGIFISFTNKKNETLNKVLYIIMSIAIIVTIFISYSTPLNKMIQHMMNNFFIVVFFPTTAVYLAALISMNIILWISIFSFKSSKQIKALNITIFVIMNYILFLLLNVIQTEKLDIYDQASIYGNKQATALIELSSVIFIVWIIFLVIYKLILIYLRKDYRPKVKKIIIRKQVKKLPENYEPKEIPTQVYGKIIHKEPVVNTNIEVNNNEEIKEYENRFTLEEYKLFSRILKEQQEMKKNNNVIIEDEYRKKQKEEIIRLEEERKEQLRKEQEKIEREHQEKKEKEQQEQLILEKQSEEEREYSKLTELERLYREINY